GSPRSPDSSVAELRAAGTSSPQAGRRAFAVPFRSDRGAIACGGTARNASHDQRRDGIADITRFFRVTVKPPNCPIAPLLDGSGERIRGRVATVARFRQGPRFRQTVLPSTSLLPSNELGDSAW